MDAVLSDPEQSLQSPTSGAQVSEAAASSAQMSAAVYEGLLGDKMKALQLNGDAECRQQHQQSGDGSDSGVDIASSSANVTLQRALSSNSGGYTSSHGLPDDTSNGVNLSCDSSMISCSSDLAELKLPVAAVEGGGGGGGGGGGISSGVINGRPSVSNFECASENGSESSSICGTPTTSTARRPNNYNNVRKKVAMFEPVGLHANGQPPTARVGGAAKEKGTSARTCGVAAAPAASQLTSHILEISSTSTPVPVRPRGLSGLKRAASLPRPSHGSSAAQVRDRLNEKLQSGGHKPTSTCLTPLRVPQRAAAKPLKPDSLPSVLCRTTSASMQRLVQRTPSLSRARTPSTPDDGRWPAVSASRSAVCSSSSGGGGGGGGGSGMVKRGLSVTPDLASLRTRTSLMGSAEMKLSSSSPYGTLPRRRKQKSVEDLTGRSSRSSSVSRESRMASSAVLGSRKGLAAAHGGSVTPQPQTKSLTSSLAAAGAFLKPSSARKSLSLSQSQSQSQSQLQLQTYLKPPASKTRIYHETASQTALTSRDLEKAFAGVVSTARAVDSVEQRDQGTQTEGGNAELERLRKEVQQLAQREHDLSAKLKREREEKLSIQRELHLNTERVMGMLALARVSATATGGSGRKSVDDSTPTSEEGDSHNSLLLLESQIQISGHELVERQQEIGQLRKLCRSLQLEMERSLLQQESLLQEKAAIEQESNELQDFLQHEKAAMCDALKDLELEYQECQRTLTSRNEEVKVLRDECRHLVRLNEQRRQENRMLQTKCAALETKFKELMRQQNASLAGATAALSGLHTRLDNLVEQLVFSYNISEHDLEDVGFQNENPVNSGEASADCESQALRLTLNGSESAKLPHAELLSQPPAHALASHQLLRSVSEDPLSPQRNQSFIAAVISAIRNATTHSGKRLLVRPAKRVPSNTLPNNERPNNGDDSDSTEMLDSETEPCLMMDNVLEDVPMPDSHSHNMVSSSCAGLMSQTELPAELGNGPAADESLANLSQAIVNRQHVELQVNAMTVLHSVAVQLNEPSVAEEEEMSAHDSLAEMPSLVEYSATQAVVDQVIEVDSLVTKLLKVLRLIQIDNDNCIQQLILDKNKLQQNKEDMLEKLKDLQDVNVKLQDELMDATQELMMKNNDLSNTKAEMQRHRNQIDRLTEDICNLSTLCSNYRKLSPSTELPPFPPTAVHLDTGEMDDIAGILNLLKMWQAEGHLQDSRVRSFLAELLARHNSMSVPKGGDDEHNSSSNSSSSSIKERLRIYANQLENVVMVLDTCDSATCDNPALQQLRRDLDVVRLNANWTPVIASTCCGEDVNAN